MLLVNSTPVKDRKNWSNDYASATHMLRAYPPSPLASQGGLPIYDGSPALTVIHVLNIIVGSASVPPTAKARSCYILSLYQIIAVIVLCLHFNPAALVRDEKEIEKIAVDVGSLEKVTALLLAITPGDRTEWDDDEAEGTARLREVCHCFLAFIWPNHII